MRIFTKRQADTEPDPAQAEALRLLAETSWGREEPLETTLHEAAQEIIEGTAQRRVIVYRSEDTFEHEHLVAGEVQAEIRAQTERFHIRTFCPADEIEGYIDVPESYSWAYAETVADGLQQIAQEYMMAAEELRRMSAERDESGDNMLRRILGS